MVDVSIPRGAGRLKPFDPPPTAEEVSQREMNTAWAGFLYRLDQFADAGPEERALRDAELTEIYGEPSMRVLAMPQIGAVTRESVQDFFDWMDRREAA